MPETLEIFPVRGGGAAVWTVPATRNIFSIRNLVRAAAGPVVDPGWSCAARPPQSSLLLSLGCRYRAVNTTHCVTGSQ